MNPMQSLTQEQYERLEYLREHKDDEHGRFWWRVSYRNVGWVVLESYEGSWIVNTVVDSLIAGIAFVDAWFEANT